MFQPIISQYSTHYGNNRWVTFSVKMGRIVHLYSDLEYDHWVLVETDPDIIQFCEQPLRMRVLDNGSWIESIPDMWVKRSDGVQQIIEIKYSPDVDPLSPKCDQRALKQLAIQRQWCLQHEMQHVVRTELTIRSNVTYLENMKLVIGYLRNGSISSSEAKIQRCFEASQGRPHRICELAKLTNVAQHEVLNVVSKMFVLGKLDGNFNDIPLSLQTEVWTRELQIHPANR